MLEETVVPLYYARDVSGLPTTWLRVVRRAIQTVTPRFSARRMMKEYVAMLYREALTAPSPRPAALSRQRPRPTPI
jgi:starch phosphorylase